MRTEDVKFYFDKTLKAFMKGRPLTGENGPLKPPIKRLTEAALEAELVAHLTKREGPNRRNGRTGKSLKTSEGLVELLAPRDRGGPSVQEQGLPHYLKCGHGGQEGDAGHLFGRRRERLRLADDPVRSSEAGSQKDADSLRGRAEGIPRGHRVHLPGDAGSALHRPPDAQLPPLCRLEGQATVCPRHEGGVSGPNLDAAEAALDKLEEAWGDKYRVAIRSWRDKRAYLSAYFRYPPDIRRMTCTANAIESVRRQFRKLTKTKSAFSGDNALLKLLYVAIKNAEKKWTKPLRNWGVTLSQLSIFFKDQTDDILDS